MPKIALYNLLKRIPDVPDDEAKEAVADVASSKKVATKLDIAELKSHILMAIIAATGIILVGVGLIVKFS